MRHQIHTPGSNSRPEERKFGWPRLRITEAPGLVVPDDGLDECPPMTSAQLRSLGY